MVGSLDEFGDLLKIITKRCNPLTVLPFRCDNLSMLQKTVVLRLEGGHFETVVPIIVFRYKSRIHWAFQRTILYYYYI